MTSHARAGESGERYPVVVELPVAWGDMDFFRHVNNTVFFRYFESARIAYLERIGFARELEESGVGPILHSTHCRFRLPLSYPDSVQACARVTRVEEDRFTMEYRVVSLRQQGVAAEGGGVVVSFDYRAGRKAAIPPAVRAAIGRLEGWTPGEGEATGSSR